MIIIHGSLFDHSQKHKSECRNHPVYRTEDIVNVLKPDCILKPYYLDNKVNFI